MIEVLHLLIQLEEHLEHILAVLITIIDTLHHRDGRRIVLLTDIELRQGFHIGHVLRRNGSRLLDTGLRLLLVLQRIIILCQEIPGLSSLRVQLHTVAQQIEGRIIVALLPLHHRLKEEMIVSPVYS